jgi:hypothetical protein
MGISASGKRTVTMATRNSIAFFDSIGNKAKLLMLKRIITPKRGINTGCRIYESVLNSFFDMEFKLAHKVERIGEFMV